MTRAERRALNKAAHVNRGRAGWGNGAGQGGPASRLPRAGAGWGGPRRGAHELRLLKPAGDPESDAIRAMSHDPDIKARNEAWAEEMRAVLYRVATTGDAEMARISAADKLLDRIEGKPVAKTLVGGAEDAGPVQIKVILEDLTTDAEAGDPEAAPAPGED